MPRYSEAVKADVRRTPEISASTYHDWQQLFDGMQATKASAVRLLRRDFTFKIWSRRAVGSNRGFPEGAASTG